MKIVIFAIVLIQLVQGLDNFVAGSFAAVDSVNWQGASFLVFDNQKKIFIRPPTSDTELASSVSNRNNQLSNGNFAWISPDALSVRWYTYQQNEPSTVQTLGEENGLFLTEDCVNCGTQTTPPPNTARDTRVSNGALTTIATSGNWVAVCGTFNMIGDYQLSNPVRAPACNFTSTDCRVKQGIAVFQVNVSTSWRIVWPDSYSSTGPQYTPQPWSPQNEIIDCNTLTGVGAQGYFIVEETLNSLQRAWRLRATDGQWLKFKDNYNWWRQNPLGKWRYFQDKLYALITPDPDNTNTKDKLLQTATITDDTATWKNIATLSTTGITNVKDAALYGNRITGYEAGPSDAIWAKFSQTTYEWKTGTYWDHSDRYIFSLNSATNSWSKISQERMAPSPKVDLNINRSTQPVTNGFQNAFTLQYDMAASTLVVYGDIKEIIKVKSGVDPENGFNCSINALNQGYCKEAVDYAYDNFHGKRVNYLVQPSGSSLIQAYGGGFEQLPTSILARYQGEKNTYFFGGQSWAYNRISLHMAHYQFDSTANQNLWAPKNLKNGVDDDLRGGYIGVVNHAQYWGSNVLLAGKFRTIDQNEVYSFATVDANGAPTSVGGGVRKIVSSAGNAGSTPWDVQRLPGEITQVGWVGNTIYIIGDFNWVGDLASGQVANNIAAYNTDTKTWNSLDGGVASPNDIWISGNDVYVGGSFARAGTLGTNNVARWNHQDQKWYAMNYGLNGAVNFLRPGLGGIVAFGAFTDSVWRWTGSVWWHVPVRPSNTSCSVYQCAAPASITDVYVLHDTGYLIAGGKLWTYGGTYFHPVDTEYTFGTANVRQMGVAPSGNLLIWNQNGPSNIVSHGAVEYDPGRHNFIPTEASFDSVSGSTVKFTTEVEGSISGVSVLKPLFSLLVIALVFLF